MTPLEILPLSTDSLRGRISRRTVLIRGSAASLALVGIRPGSPETPATVPVVTVAAPTLVPDDCTVNLNARVTLTVQATLTNLASGVDYAIRGTILEDDSPVGNADVCGDLLPRVISAARHGSYTLLLRGRMKAVALGLVKGHGPARDESVSPDLVELLVHVWLRNLRTGADMGPWASPPRTAVSREIATWRSPGPRLGSELAIPRIEGATVRDDGAPFNPPQRCGS